MDGYKLSGTRGEAKFYSAMTYAKDIRRYKTVVVSND